MFPSATLAKADGADCMRADAASVSRPLRLSSHSRVSQAPSFGEGTQHLFRGNPPLSVAKRAVSAPNREPVLSDRLQTRVGLVSATS